MSKYEAMFGASMAKAGVVPYRVGGRVRVAAKPDLPKDAVEKMRELVKVMAKHVSESLSEPDGVMKENWRKAQLRPLDICDEVCPEGVNLTQCPVEWLVERCARYHFDLSLTETNPPALKFVPHEGWELLDKTHSSGLVIAGVKSIIPGWFADACRRRKGEIVEYLKNRTVSETDTPNK